MEITKRRCQLLINAGANVILCTNGIDEFALKYFVEAKAIAVRRVTKQDLRRIAKASGGSVVTTFADENGQETVDPAILGDAEEVSERI